MSVLKGYYPENVFGFFEDICAIPHGSGDEERIADYIESVCREAGVYVYRDRFNNVFARKNAKEGFEDYPAGLLQGHTDMVCEKSADSTHDFTKDGLKLQVKDGFLTASGTTLGADNGIAVAMMLGVLTDKELEHGVVECLFTVDEERGMTGAANFDFSCVSARRVINLDSEAEGECIVSCAGGTDIGYSFENEYIKNVHPTARITVSGLSGGHSGADIHLGRLNANNCMARFLWDEYNRKPFQLISIDGGDKRNVITGECTALISCDHIDELRQRAALYNDELRSRAYGADKKVRVTVDKKGVRERALSFSQTSRILRMMNLAPAGMLEKEPEGMVVASANLGVVSTGDERVELQYLFRFNAKTYYDEYRARYEALGELLGARTDIGGYYSCWEKREGSELVQIYRDVYSRLYNGREARVSGLHAGVECGFISEGLFGEADLISIGPDMFDIHTPRERLDILSAGRTYGLLLKLLCQK